MAIDIGRVAYTNYADYMRAQLKENCFPRWEELSKPECDAWRHAAVEVLQHIEKERKQLELDKLEDADGFEM
jgi:hypothetical protein